MKIKIVFKEWGKKRFFDEHTKKRLRELIRRNSKVLEDFDAGTNEITLIFRSPYQHGVGGCCYVNKNIIVVRPSKGESAESILKTFYHEFGHLVHRNTRSQLKAEQVADYCMRNRGENK